MSPDTRWRQSSQLLIQLRLFRLNLLYQPYHCGVVCRHNMRQRQTVNVHYGPSDILQPFLAYHAFVHNTPRIGMDIVDAEYSQNI